VTEIEVPGSYVGNSRSFNFFVHSKLISPKLLL